VTRVVSKLFARWIVVVVAAALVLGATPLAADSKSGNEKVDPTLLADARANPDRLFPVIVRGAALPSASRKSTAKNGGNDDQSKEEKKDEDNTDRVKKAERAISAVSKDGERRVLSIVGGASGTMRGSEIVDLSKSPLIDRIVRNEPFSVPWIGAEAASAATQAGIQEVNAPAAWSTLGASGQGVGVAVIDSGVADHPDLAGRIIARVDLTGERSNGDPGGHGTHVAGLIAGDGTASNGAWTGVAPKADIVSVRVIDATGHAKLSSIFAGMQWVLKNRSTYHIKVVNMSFGATALTGYQEDLLASAAEFLYFAGMTVVASAGNSGPGQSTVTSPGADPFVLTVGAADDSGTATLADDSIAVWSSRGPTAFDGIAKPDLVAPGRKMIGLRAAGSTIDNAYPARRISAAGAADAQYFTMSGTSMSAAVVSGVAALYLEHAPGAAPQAVKQQLTATANPLRGHKASAQGAGMVDALAALTAVPARVRYTRYAASTAFAELVRTKVAGQPLVWRDLSFHRGVDSRGVPWRGITWEDITWDGITWENITWEAFNWQGITWEDITWEDITWETAQ
jgi:serine protease AprX